MFHFGFCLTILISYASLSNGLQQEKCHSQCKHQLAKTGMFGLKEIDEVCARHCEIEVKWLIKCKSRCGQQPKGKQDNCKAGCEQLEKGRIDADRPGVVWQIAKEEEEESETHRGQVEGEENLPGKNQEVVCHEVVIQRILDVLIGDERVEIVYEESSLRCDL